MRWKAWCKWSLLCLLTALGLQVFAADLATQRKNFVYASNAIEKGNLTEYYRLKPLLADYPLYPYLQYAEINRMMAQGLPTTHVETFLNTYPRSALASRMQNNWLRALAKQQQWALYQQFYTPSDDVALQCYSIWAEYKTTQNSEVLAKAAPIWTQARSQPNECNALFAAWQKSSSFSSKDAWARTQLAIAANQTSLITYLKRFLPSNQASLADLALSVQKNPSLVTSSNLFKNKDPYAQTIQVLAMKRLINQNADLAQTTWTSIKDQYPFTTEQRGEVNYAFAIQYSVSHDDKAIAWLNAVPTAQMDAPIYEWRVRYALRHQDWQATLKYINEMPLELKQQPLWRYWQGRAHLATNQTDKAHDVLQPLAKERNYHGMLASDLLKLPYSLNDQSYVAPTAVKASVENDPGIIRARELFALNRVVDARREWDASTRHFDEQQLQTAANLAYSMQWYDRSVLTVAKAQNRNDLTVRFPLAYANDMKKSANKQGIPPAWAFAITRQESAFLADAKSPANAVGLMQLLPSTAKQVAQQIGQPYNDANLTVPAKNIALGTAYLKQLSSKFNHNNLLASAAYNAGASRVYRWLPNEKMPTDIWVETIPYRETRNYVQNVFSYQVIYQEHLGEPMERLNHHASYVGP